MTDMINIRGFYTIESVNILTRTTEVWTITNLVTQGFYDGVHRLLDHTQSTPAADIIDLQTMELGTGTTPPARTDTSLETSYFSKALTTKSFTDNLFTARLSVGAPEGNPAGGYIKEVGIFAGTRMISRASVNIQKNSNIQLLITWQLSMGV